MQTNTRLLVKRLVVDIILFLGTFVAPLWLLILLAILCLFVFENFYEIIIIGIIIDSLYGLPTEFLPIPIIYTLSTSLLFIARAFLKKHLKF